MSRCACGEEAVMQLDPWEKYEAVQLCPNHLADMKQMQWELDKIYDGALFTNEETD